MALKNYFFEDYWQVGIIAKPLETILSDKEFFSGLQIIPTPGSYFLADPFWAKDLAPGTFLAEKFCFKTQQGSIVSVRVPGDGQPETTTLLSGSHFSFPFLFTDENETYLVPENSENGSLKRYALNDLANVQTVMALPVVDPILFKYKNTFYLFCTLFDGTENKKTGLYFSDQLSGEWIRHPQSPVCSSFNGARMAGSILSINGNYYRPGQDCSTEYGGGITLFEITSLSKTGYSEKAVKTISAPPNFSGIHTLNQFGNQTLVDLKTKRLSLVKSFRRLRRKFN